MTELEGLEERLARTQRRCLYLEGQIHRLKLKPLTPEEREESLRVCRNIGKNLEEAGE